MYNENETEASKSALLELGLALKRYHEDMVLAGGWAPYFISSKFFAHCGSVDIDFVLKTTIMKKYDSIKKTIIDLGYEEENEFRFLKEVVSPINGMLYPIHVDFLCEKEGLKYAKIRNVQDDLKAFAFDGCNIAFDFNFKEEVATVLPKSGRAKTAIKVVDLVGSLALKGHAIDGRYKTKDFYDIYSLTFFNGSPQKAAEYFNDCVSNKTLGFDKIEFIKHSLSVIQERFEYADSMGSYEVETFTNKNIRREDVYARIDSFLKAIKIT